MRGELEERKGRREASASRGRVDECVGKANVSRARVSAKDWWERSACWCMCVCLFVCLFVGGWVKLVFI